MGRSGRCEVARVRRGVNSARVAHFPSPSGLCTGRGGARDSAVMPPPPHYLDRLQRLSRSEAALAMELARDATAVRAFLDEMHRREPTLPRSDRYGLPLG